MIKTRPSATQGGKPARSLPHRLAGRLGRLVTGASVIGLLAGCGGGGGGNDSAGLVNLAPAAAFLAEGFVQSFDSFVDDVAALRRLVPYDRQDNRWRFTASPGEPLIETNPLASARIDYAHAAGLTGRGVKIAVMDEGFLRGHEVFAGKTISTASTLGVADHGTAVASVLAGRSGSFIGVAPGADLLLGSYDTATDRLALTQRAITDGAMVISNSWGFQQSPATLDSFETIFSDETDSAYLAAMQQFARRGVIVFAASNTADDTRSGIMEALPLFVPELTPGWLAVINADATWTETEILSAVRLSAPCGDAAPWCLAAEGTWDAATASGTTSYALVTGTSFAVPMVSGALALLQEAFPNQTPHQLRVRLLASADNGFSGFSAAGSVELAEGVYHSYSREWGHGFLDVRAALLPIGTPESRMADGRVIDVSEPVAVTGGAVGDAISRSLGGTEMLVTDALGGDFLIAPDAVLARAATPDAAARLALAGLAPQGAAGLSFADYGGAQMRLRTGALEIAALAPAIGADRQSMGLSVGRTFGSDAGALYLGLNVTQDDGRLLPAPVDGSGAVLSGIEIGYSADAGDAFLSIGGGIAWAEADAMGPVGAADLTLTQFGLTAGARAVIRQGDSLRVAVNLPMAVSKGQGTAVVPTSRSAGGLVYDSLAVDFAPEAREVNLSLVYDTPVGPGASAYIGAIRSLHHGNVAGQTDSAATVGLRLRF